MGASGLGAQIPQRFTNLHYYPEDISRGELVGAMRQFSFALGVRCQYCHVGGDGESFDGVDFASDDKLAKRRARAMLEMAETINTTLLSDLPERATPAVDVQCRTCHRGLARPRMIDDLLRERITAEGVDAAVAYYRELREREYGGWSYDFSEWVITDLANDYVRADDPQTAAALMRMNAEFHAESFSVWAALGGTEAAAGNRDAAIAAYRRGLELSPDDPQILRLLERLGVSR